MLCVSSDLDCIILIHRHTSMPLLLPPGRRWHPVAGASAHIGAFKRACARARAAGGTGAHAGARGQLPSDAVHRLGDGARQRGLHAAAGKVLSQGTCQAGSAAAGCAAVGSAAALCAAACTALLSGLWLFVVVVALLP